MSSFESMPDADVTAYAGLTKHKSRLTRGEATAKIIPFAAIEPEPITWLWPQRIAIGKLAIFAGDPGLGKSQGSLDVAARLSNGIAFPDGARVTEIGDSLVLTSEDDPGDTIRPRLDALGADLSRIHFLRCKVGSDGKQDFPSLLDLGIFEDAANQIIAGGGRLRLLIVDPIEGFLAGTDAYKNSEVRAILGPLVALAARLGFSILGIQHLNKSNGSAAYRVGGSIAFTALARAVWIFAKDPNDQDRRLFLCLKNNLGVDLAGLEYRIEQAVNGAPMIRWLGPADDDVRTVLSQDRPKREREKIAPEQDRVLDYLREQAPAAVQRKELADHLGKSPTATNNILNKLRDQGLIRPAAGMFGYWQLEQSPPDTLVMTGDSSDSSDGLPQQSSQSLQSPVISSERGSDCCDDSEAELEIY